MEISDINNFTKYSKFSSPFKKDEKYINTEELSQGLPKGRWIKTEKIDGTNIRIILTKPNEDGLREVLIGSRKLILNEEDKGSKQYLHCIKEINLFKLKEYFKEVNSTTRGSGTPDAIPNTGGGGSYWAAPNAGWYGGSGTVIVRYLL